MAGDTPTLAAALEDWLTADRWPRPQPEYLPGVTSRHRRTGSGTRGTGRRRRRSVGDRAGQRRSVDARRRGAHWQPCSARGDPRGPGSHPRTLAGLCAHLVHQRQLSVDPLTVAGLERPKLPKSLPRYVVRDTEIARVLSAAG